MFKVLAASVRKGPASFSSAVKKKKMLEWKGRGLAATESRVSIAL